MPHSHGAIPPAARDAWAGIVGAAHVIDHRAATAAAATATFATDVRVPLIVCPETHEQVQACVRVAHAHGIPLYPVSSGLNWGYGSRVPVSDGNVILDLGRMRRIVDFDESLAYVTVEPGVTQQQLFEFLQAQRSGLWMDATGTSPAASLIGNTMERGFGHTPYGDHFAHVCALQVVLGDGSCVETGFARYGASPSVPVYRWGLGPVLDGLFTQSNFGVVTRMTIWLMPAPEYFQAYFFRCDNAGDLGRAIDAIRPLKLSGTLRSAAHIGNDYKVLNGLQQYPWEAMGGRTPLTPADMAPFRRRLRIGLWNGSGGLYGTRAQVAADRDLVRKQLKGVTGRLEFLDDGRLALARRFSTPYRMLTGWDVSAALTLLEPVYGLMQGVPTAQPLATAYWRKREPPPVEMNPDRDRCGLLWCAPGCAARRRPRRALVGPRLHGAAVTRVRAPHLDLAGHGTSPDLRDFHQLRPRRGRGGWPRPGVLPRAARRARGRGVSLLPPGGPGGGPAAGGRQRPAPARTSEAGLRPARHPGARALRDWDGPVPSDRPCQPTDERNVTARRRLCTLGLVTYRADKSRLCSN